MPISIFNPNLNKVNKMNIVFLTIKEHFKTNICMNMSILNLHPFQNAVCPNDSRKISRESRGHKKNR